MTNDAGGIAPCPPRTLVECADLFARMGARGEDLEPVVVSQSLDAIVSDKPTPGQDDRARLLRAAVAIGAAQRAVVLARLRAASRVISGRPLIEMQSSAHRIAAVAVELAAAKRTLRAACAGEDAGIPSGYRGASAVAAACSVAHSAAAVLAQTYGAAGTSDAEPVAAIGACIRAAHALGPLGALRDVAGRRRSIELSRKSAE